MEHDQVLGLEKANSAEFDPDTPDPVVIFMPEVCIHSELVLKKSQTIFWILHSQDFKSTCRALKHTWEVLCDLGLEERCLKILVV